LRYRLSRKANRDLNEIWEYTVENWSEEQADKYYQLLINEIELLVQYTDNHIYSKELFGYKMHMVKSHLIFYKIAGQGAIEVVRVLHKNMDIKRKLSE